MALVLWGRIQPQLGDAEQQQFWERHGSLVVPWMIRIINSPPTSHDDDEEEALVYERLVAQILAGCCSRGASDRKNVVVDPLGTALAAVWDQRRYHSAWNSKVDSDILQGLQVWCKFNNDWSRTDHVLHSVVERLHSTNTGTSDSSTSPPGDDNEQKQTLSMRKDDDEDASNTPQNLMMRTLEALLDQAGSDPPGDSPTMTTVLERTGWWKIFIHHAQRRGSSRPSFWLPLLQWWCDNRASQADRRAWAPVLLLSASTNQQQPETCLVAVLEQQPKDNDRSDLLSLWTKFLLACVTAPHEQNDEVRALAWSPGAAMMQDSACDWLVTADPGKSRLGRAAPLCAWLRLAAGEWKIQLGLLLSLLLPNGDYSDDDNKSQQALRLTVQACGWVLTLGLQYMTLMADQMSDRQLSLSADAILHIQKSLQEALHSSVQFLGSLPGVESFGASTNLAVERDVAVRVFGVLVSEMDVFDMVPLSKGDAMDGENEGLHALSVALQCQSSIETQESLLPGLATVLASSEGDSARTALLKDYLIVGIRLDEFLQVYFERTANLESIRWACQVIDLWASLIPLAHTDHRPLLGAILECLQRLLSLDHETEKLGPAMSGAVASYVTLKGEDPPGDAECLILQQAMETASRFATEIT